MAAHNELGKLGENAATDFLKAHGYTILERNWTEDRFEIDIIAENEESIVFVEVKTRTSTQWGRPSDFIGRAKIKRIVEAADLYIKLHDIDKSARFDIISSVWNNGKFEIEHIDDAFLSPLF